MSDDKIFKKEVKFDNDTEIEEMLSKCEDGELYDVVIRSNV